MPQVSSREFERLPLRAHEFLAGVPLHDVWAVDLPHLRPGITLDEFLRAASNRPFRCSLPVRMLLALRLRLGSFIRPFCAASAPDGTTLSALRDGRVLLIRAVEVLWRRAFTSPVSDA